MFPRHLRYWWFCYVLCRLCCKHIQLNRSILLHHLSLQLMVCCWFQRVHCQRWLLQPREQPDGILPLQLREPDHRRFGCVGSLIFHVLWMQLPSADLQWSYHSGRDRELVHMLCLFYLSIHNVSAASDTHSPCCQRIFGMFMVQFANLKPMGQSMGSGDQRAC